MNTKYKIKEQSTYTNIKIQKYFPRSQKSKNWPKQKKKKKKAEF